ncbi:MAG: HAD family hydrolase [Labilithrix sp.]|nr:HAD family hydrolase [Labilithrix sp.]MCW5812372.1 HAD family hydrolase [Labilithrix sp.]
MQQRPTVLLFDLDGTLVSTGGAGRRAMAEAARIHGVPNVFDGFSFAGMTDRAIARYAFNVGGFAPDTPTPDTALARSARGASRPLKRPLLGPLRGVVSDQDIEHFLETYVGLLEEELPRSEGYLVLPGVAALVRSLGDHRHLAIGLGTGNIKRGAYAKLVRAALGDAFAFGGFGCDAEDRTELLRAGAERGAARLGRPLAECRVVVIGDTPKDVAAAKGLAAECVAVATGGFTCAALRACGAEHAFATLAEPGVHDMLVGTAT